MLAKWDMWATQNESENSRPDIYKPSDLFMALEMEYGGTDLEKYKLTCPSQIVSIFHQLVYALALAEKQLEFEHRDMYSIPNNCLQLIDM